MHSELRQPKGQGSERLRFSVDRSNRLLASLLELDELCNRHITTFAYAPPVELDSRDFMKSFGREVAGSTMWTAYDGHVLNHKQRWSFSIAAGYRSGLDADAAAILAAILFTLIPHTR